MGGGEAETESLILRRAEGRGRDRKSNFEAYSARIVSGWVVLV